MQLKQTAIVMLLTASVSAGTTTAILSAERHHRDASNAADYAEMACSSHSMITPRMPDYAGELVRLAINTVRSGNVPLHDAAYRLQQDVAKYGASSPRVEDDRARVTQLCASVLAAG